MKRSFEVWATSVLLICAVAVTCGFLYRVIRPDESTGQIIGAPAQVVTDWPAIVNAGFTIAGSPTAPDTMVVMTDFECPACRSFHTKTAEFLKNHPSELPVIYVHFPLEMHRFALPAARVTECLRDRMSVNDWIDTLFAKQDSLGLMSWGLLASRAGAVDTTGLTACAAASQNNEKIVAGLELGKKIGARGTPTVVVNGWKFSSPVSMKQLDSIIMSGQH